MEQGESASKALAQLLAEDEGRELRQVAMVDSQGQASDHRGARCMAHAGYITGDGFSVQANMMLNRSVWRAMAQG